jgi:exosortase/archaeosortase
MTDGNHLGSIDASTSPKAMAAGLRVSTLSAAWTIVASTAAVALGIRDQTAVLVAFGALGFVDALGSIALALHFRHGLRHEQLSETREAFAHRVVLVGLVTIGSVALVGGLVRLAHTRATDASTAGTVLAAVSLVVLAGLSTAKQRIARRVSSDALLSDGHLSMIGALQAGVTLAGTGLGGAFGWHWVDPVATAIVGGVAVGVGLVTWRRSASARAPVGRPHV